MDREDKNINSAVRVSKVFNIDESKLVFKVIVGVANYPTAHGEYRFDLPPITDLCNSNEYNQAIIKLDQVIIDPQSGVFGNVAENNTEPVWTNKLLGPGNPGGTVLNTTKISTAAVMLVMSIPSRQTGHTSNDQSIVTKQDGQLYYKFNELIPTFWTWRGNYEGIQPTNNGALLGQKFAAGNSYAITHKPNHEGVMCANPFGSTINFNYKIANDIEGSLRNVYLAEETDNTLPRNDITKSFLQLTITLLPNK